MPSAHGPIFYRRQKNGLCALTCSDKKSDLSFRQFVCEKKRVHVYDFSPMKNRNDVIQQ